MVTEIQQQQQLYYAKYDSDHDYSRPEVPDSKPIGLINLQDKAVISIFDAAADELVSINTANISNNSNWLSQISDFSRLIKSNYYKYAGNFKGIRYLLTEQSAKSAEAEFEKLTAEYKTKAQEDINKDIQKAKERAEFETKEDEANAPVSEEARALRDEIQSKGFSKYALKLIQVSQDKDMSFVSLNGKYIVDGQEVDEKTFLEKYEQAIKDNKNGKFEKPYCEQFDEHSVTDNQDGTFSSREFTNREYIYNYNGNLQYQEIHCDKKILPHSDYEQLLANSLGGTSPGDNAILNGAEIKDNNGTVVFTKENNKYYNNNGQEVPYWQVSSFIEKNQGVTVKMGFYKPNSFGI